MHMRPRIWRHMSRIQSREHLQELLAGDLVGGGCVWELAVLSFFLGEELGVGFVFSLGFWRCVWRAGWCIVFSGFAGRGDWVICQWNGMLRSMLDVSLLRWIRCRRIRQLVNRSVSELIFCGSCRVGFVYAAFRSCHGVFLLGVYV